MPNNYRLSLVILTAIAVCTACSQGGVELSNRAVNADFTLVVLAETDSHCTSACTWNTAVAPTDSGCIVSVSATGANGQKALYFDLAYDAETMHPVLAEPVDSALECEPLSVSILDDRGTVHFGMILPNPAEREGFSGDGAIATVEFEYGAAALSRRISSVPTHVESQTALGDAYPTSLYWVALNIGDCNQDGLVNATDLTPIGVNYDPAATITGWLATPAMRTVDTDNNGLITAADITAIGRNFGNSILGGYRVYSSNDPGDYPTDGVGANGNGAILSGAVGFSESRDLDLSIYLRSYGFDPPGASVNTFYWVRPLNLDGTEGIASTLITQIGLDTPRGDEYSSHAWFDSEDSTLKLLWTYSYPGDYNQDFIISPSDLTPLGQYMGENGPFDDMSIQSVLDGNMDGRIDNLDIYYIPRTLYDMPKYAIFCSDNPGIYPQLGDSPSLLEPLVTIEASSAISNDWPYPMGRGWLEYVIEDPQPGAHYWVRLIDDNGMCGPASNMVEYIAPE